jgi:hypothetical protein
VSPKLDTKVSPDPESPRQRGPGIRKNDGER